MPGCCCSAAARAEWRCCFAHPGGPFWKHKDAGAWTVPKGIAEAGEDLLAAASRECAEETGLRPDGPFLELGNIRQKAGKMVHVCGV